MDQTSLKQSKMDQIDKNQILKKLLGSSLFSIGSESTLCLVECKGSYMKSLSLLMDHLPISSTHGLWFSSRGNNGINMAAAFLTFSQSPQLLGWKDSGGGDGVVTDHPIVRIMWITWKKRTIHFFYSLHIRPAPPYILEWVPISKIVFKC